jgi:hypothetical protein
MQIEGTIGGKSIAPLGDFSVPATLFVGSINLDDRNDFIAFQGSCRNNTGCQNSPTNQDSLISIVSPPIPKSFFSLSTDIETVLSDAVSNKTVFRATERGQGAFGDYEYIGTAVITSVEIPAISGVPEPSSATLLIAGFGALVSCLIMRRR